MSLILVTCSACNASFRAAEVALGREAPCPACGKSVKVAGPTVSPFDVFISYSSKDKTIADAVVAVLESKRIRCWVAPRDIVPGKEWSESIIDGIAQSRMMVLIFSTNSNNSQQVLREVERCVHRGMPIVPFRIENQLPSRSMEYFISTHHWLDAYDPPLEQHLEKLAATCKAFLDGAPLEIKDGPKDLGSLTRKAVRTLLARDNRLRVLLAASLLMILIGCLFVGALYALRPATASPAAVQAKANAAAVMDEVRKLERGQGFDAKIAELDAELKTADGLFDQKHFAQATESFERVMTKATALKEADKDRQQAKSAWPDVEKARQDAVAAQASQFAAGAWAEAQQKLAEGQKAYDAGDFAETRARYQEAAKRFAEARVVARQSGKARLKALAFWAGYSGRAVMFADAVKNNKNLIFEQRAINEKAEACAQVLRDECVPGLKLKDDVLTRLASAGNNPAGQELSTRKVPNVILDAHGREVHSAYWLGNDVMLLQVACGFARYGFARSFGSDLLNTWKYAYEAGCPPEVIDALTASRKLFEEDRGSPLSGAFQVFPKIEAKLGPMRARHMKDIATTQAMFQQPAAPLPLTAEEREAIRGLRQLGAEFSFSVKGPFRPIIIEFPRKQPGVGSVMPMIVKLPTLEELLLRHQKISDDDLKGLHALNAVKGLNLYDTPVTDAGLVHLAKLDQLEWLTLIKTSVTDRGLDHLKNLPRLRDLWVEETGVSAAGISALQTASPSLRINPK